ncbi:MAG: RsiV family protein [Anaerolineales bacterium]
MKTSSVYKLILTGFVLGIVLACSATYTAQFPTPTSPALTQTVTLPPAPTPATPTVPNAGFTISTINFDEAGPDGEYIVTAQSPAILDSSDPVALAFNDRMQNLVQAEIAGFKQNVLDAPKDPSFAASSFDVKYNLLYQNGSLASIKFDFLGYISGAAHPYKYSATVNYDFSQGRSLALDELFSPGSDYLEAIAGFCIAELSKQPGFEGPWRDGAAPTSENYQNWNVTADGLLITFDTYQVAPGASGPQTVLVPYSELQAVIDPQGALADVTP